MLSLAEAKELLGDDASKYSDEEITKMVDFLSAVAHIVINNYLEQREE